mmetsp:Transcript_13805/g.32218  ORF Transcript_13805/g.32218 Transcript_13805/m.32218 type:complete len:336 (-) Transcript_13805:604-1611(-)
MTTPDFVFYESSEIGDDCDFDFVFIDKSLEGGISDDDTYGDGDSYDYCEDVYTTFSNNCNEQENRDDCSLLTQTSDDDLSTPTTGLKDSILTVPSLLMKDLDEAYEAAKMIRITDPEEGNDLDIAHNADQKETQERHNSQLSMSSPSDENSAANEIAAEESSVSVPISGIDRPPIPTLYESTGRTIIFLSSLQNETALPSTEAMSRLLASKLNQKESSEDSINDNKGAAVAISTSRTSNKKRRKKLKMLKKTQAAAAAADRIQQQSTYQQKTSNKYMKRTGSSSPKKQGNVTSSRLASKKVGNIAVSCAIETMANYRDELSRQQGKQNQQQAVAS